MTPNIRKDNVFLDFDADGNLVSLTIDHAVSNADLDKLALPQSGKSVELGLIAEKPRGA